MKEQYSIVLNGNKYTMLIEKTKKNRIKMRMVNSSTIKITGPLKSLNYCFEFVQKNIDWIEKNSQLIKEREQLLSIDEVKNFQKFWLFGKLYPVIWSNDGYDIDCYHFTSSRQFDKDVQIKRVRKYFHNILEKRFAYYNQIFHMNCELKIKTMKSKYGYCKYKSNLIVLSDLLIHLDFEMIDYVIVHEFCHFKVQNHSKLFYQEVSLYIPNYKLIVSKMKTFAHLNN